MQVRQSERLGEALDSVAQHCPGHPATVHLKKRFLHRLVALADLAQHPAYGFVNAVVLVIHKNRRNPDGSAFMNSPALCQRGIPILTGITLTAAALAARRGRFMYESKVCCWVMLRMSRTSDISRS